MIATLEDLQRRAKRLGRPVRLMEVCGTHTMVAFRSGLRSVLPKQVSLIAGPGCPVCVTPSGYLDAAIEIGRRPGTILATFGDLVRVPGSDSSLEEERARGAKVQVVYSPADAVELSRACPKNQVVFLAVGFETTAPTVALAISAARERRIGNFAALVAHKTMPAAMRALLEGGEVQIDGFMCPGHVSVVTGAKAFGFLAKDYHVPCVVTGFEPQDMIEGIGMLLAQVEDGRTEVEIQYRRAVSWEGSLPAQQIIHEVFAECDSEWRGLGVIPGSGLALRAQYRDLDAASRFGLVVGSGLTPRGCRCGDVLRGSMAPTACPLFGAACTPSRPVGPCMVSSEGACAAYARYGGTAHS